MVSHYCVNGLYIFPFILFSSKLLFSCVYSLTAAMSPPNNLRVAVNSMNIRKLNKKLESYESTIRFAQNEGILPSAVTFPCGSYIVNFTIINRKNGWRRAFFKCKEKNCKTKINLSKLTVFENTKLKIQQIILLMY